MRRIAKRPDDIDSSVKQDSCSNPALDAAGSKSAVSAPATSPQSVGDPLPQPATADDSFVIYAITELATSRQYVGVTCQPLQARFMGHLSDARNRRKHRRAGSLGMAIIRTVATGMPYSRAFAVRCLETTSDPARARTLEAEWIARLGTAAPAGYNLMSGGSSLGGPLNSRPITVRDHRGVESSYPSLSRALRATNRDRRRVGQRPLSPGAVYARLSLGWTIEEALGLGEHVDKRQCRDRFVWGGQYYRTLRKVSNLSGILIATLRSRLQRVRIGAPGLPNEITHDRRSFATGKRCGILVPAPDGSGLVTLQAFAAGTGVPKATVTYRYAQLVRAGERPEAMPADQIRAFLTTEQDRRIILELEIGPGVVWRGGVRELVRRVLSDWSLECRRAERIGASAIRRRLRLLPGWPDQISRRHTRWAFGFGVEAPPDLQ